MSFKPSHSFTAPFNTLASGGQGQEETKNEDPQVKAMEAQITELQDFMLNLQKENNI